MSEERKDDLESTNAPVQDLPEVEESKEPVSEIPGVGQAGARQSAEVPEQSPATELDPSNSVPSVQEIVEKESPSVPVKPDVCEDPSKDPAEVSKEDELDSPPKMDPIGIDPRLPEERDQVGPPDKPDQSEPDAARGMSPPPLEDSPPPVEVGPMEGSSESVVNELNQIATGMNRLHLPVMKLELVRLFIREPGMVFFTRPDTRRRHCAESYRARPADSTQQEEASVSETAPREVPMPILNQAGAIVGYTGPKPIKDSSDNADEPERSVSSAETIPIEEVYMRTKFSPVFFPDENMPNPCPPESTEYEPRSSSERSSRGFSEFDSSSGDGQESPRPDLDEPTDDLLAQRKLGATEAVDIPCRPGSDPTHAGSFPGAYRPVLLGRRYSLEFEPFVPPLTGDQTVPKRKISQGSTGSDKHRPLSRGSSVDLDAYMVKPLDNETSTSNEGVPSADSPRPAPDLDLSPVQKQNSDSTQAVSTLQPSAVDESEQGVDTSQPPTPEEFVPTKTSEDESVEKRD